MGWVTFARSLAPKTGHFYVIEINRTLLKDRPRWKSEEFLRWVRSQPCILTGTQDFQQVDPAHISSRGAGADDFRNVVPLRNDLHRLSHHRGWRSLLDRYGKDEAWLYEQADHTLINWLNRMAAEKAGQQSETQKGVIE